MKKAFANITFRNILGGFFGGVLGILSFHLVHAALLPVGCLVGVVVGFWHKEIYNLVFIKSVDYAKERKKLLIKVWYYYIDWKNDFKTPKIPVGKILNFLFSVLLFPIRQLRKINFELSSQIKLAKFFSSLGLILFNLLWIIPLTNYLLSIKVITEIDSWFAYFLLVSLIGAIPVIMPIGLTFETNYKRYNFKFVEKLEFMNNAAPKVLNDLQFKLFLSEFKYNNSPLFNFGDNMHFSTNYKDNDSDSGYGKLVSYYSNLNQISEIGFLKYLGRLFLRLMKNEFSSMILIVSLITYSVVSAAILLSFFWIPITIAVGTLKAIYNLAAKSGHWLCFGSTLLVTIVSAVLFSEQLTQLQLWLVAVSTGAASGIVTEVLRRSMLIITRFIDTKVAFIGGEIEYYLRPSGKKYFEIFAKVEKVFAPKFS